MIELQCMTSVNQTNKKEIQFLNLAKCQNYVAVCHKYKIVGFILLKYV